MRPFLLSVLNCWFGKSACVIISFLMGPTVECVSGESDLFHGGNLVIRQLDRTKLYLYRSSFRDSTLFFDAPGDWVTDFGISSDSSMYAVVSQMHPNGDDVGPGTTEYILSVLDSMGTLKYEITEPNIAKISMDPFQPRLAFISGVMPREWESLKDPRAGILSLPDGEVQWIGENTPGSGVDSQYRGPTQISWCSNNRIYLFRPGLLTEYNPEDESSIWTAVHGRSIQMSPNGEYFLLMAYEEPISIHFRLYETSSMRDLSESLYELVGDTLAYMRYIQHGGWLPLREALLFLELKSRNEPRARQKPRLSGVNEFIIDIDSMKAIWHSNSDDFNFSPRGRIPTFATSPFIVYRRRHRHDEPVMLDSVIVEKITEVLIEGGLRPNEKK